MNMLLIILRILLTLLAIYIIIIFIVYILQDYLVFPGKSISKSRLYSIKTQYPGIEEITLKTPDNITLHGWLLKNSTHKKSPLLIYFGGNSEEVSWMLDKGESFPGYSLLLFNYRGFGLSEGRPSEKALFNDALFLYDTFSKRDDINNNKIILFGRSLGTGVASYLAANRPVEAVILVSPYDSITNVGKSVFPFLPVKFILKHKFDSYSLADKIEAPLLVIAALKDTIVPINLSIKLFDKWAGKKEMIKIDHACHNSISYFDEYWSSITDFIKRIKACE